MSTTNLGRDDKIRLLHAAGYTFGVLSVIGPQGERHMSVDDAHEAWLRGA